MPGKMIFSLKREKKPSASSPTGAGPGKILEAGQGHQSLASAFGGQGGQRGQGRDAGHLVEGPIGVTPRCPPFATPADADSKGGKR